MAYLVVCYVEDHAVRKPRGFSTRDDALRYLVELATDAEADGLTTIGDPLDGGIIIKQGDEIETFRLVETSDRKLLKMAQTPSLQPRLDQRLP